MLAEISKLENLYKTTQSQEVKQELEAAIFKLKELDATSAVKYLLYAKRYFVYRDKLNKVLARVFAESVNKIALADVMFSKDGSLVSSLEDELAAFSHYYRNLYTS